MKVMYFYKGEGRGLLADLEKSMNKYQLERKRREEQEEITSELSRGTREINRNMNEFEGWADRLMRSILSPTGKDMQLWYNPLSIKKGGAPYKREQ